MNGSVDAFWVVVRIATRNLLANRWRTAIIGAIVGVAAFLVVVGSSLLDTVDHAMRRSIIGSLTGHIQIYSSESAAPLDVVGGTADPNDIIPFPEFEKVRATVLSVPNVASVVPMGISMASTTSGNAIDHALAELRTVVDNAHGDGAALSRAVEYGASKGRIRQMVGVLGRGLTSFDVLHDTRDGEPQAAVRDALSQSFWDSFDRDAYGHLEFLENRVAPLALDSSPLFLRYVGTDPAAFAKAFDRLVIVDGRPIRTGERGFLFSKNVYEEQVKLRAARGFDHIKSARELRHAEIGADAELQAVVRDNTAGVGELLLQLDSAETTEVRRDLQAFLRLSEPDVAILLREFLDVDDTSFDARYAFFYGKLAPKLELYRVRMGDFVTLKTFAKGGYVRSANLRVCGTFDFRGLERSPQAGSLNMIDLVSFRELYGFVTAEGQHEIDVMRDSAGAKDIGREQAELELFGADPVAEGRASSAAPAEPDALDVPAAPRATLTRAVMSADYDPKELVSGTVLNAAVIVRDESRLDETARAIEEAGKRAGLPIRAISWRAASGLLGQFASLMRLVLYAAVVVVLVVGLVVMNNALVMAALERIKEIGTLRALGAQKTFVAGLLLLESSLVGLLWGAAGTLAGSVFVVILGEVGIPASNDVLTFFFSGPRLSPTVGGQGLVVALGAVLLVSVASGAYPGWLAMRVSPREAMQSED